MSEKVVWVSYASGSYKKNIFWNKFFVRHIVKPDKIIFFTDDDLKKTQTYRENREVLDGDRGGFYAWKPWAIKAALDSMDDNDILIYQDCGKGLRYKNFLRPKNLVQYIRDNNIVPGVKIPYYGRNDKWTHVECFKVMGCDDELYYGNPQIETAVLGFKKCESSVSIVNDWLSFCLMKNVIQSVPDELISKQREGFIEHRWDQSVLTNLAIKNQVKPIELDFNEVQISKSVSVIEISLMAKSSILRNILIFAIVKATAGYRSAMFNLRASRS